MCRQNRAYCVLEWIFLSNFVIRSPHGFNNIIGNTVTPDISKSPGKSTGNRGTTIFKQQSKHISRVCYHGQSCPRVRWIF